ncbi:MAG: ImmA/IrrE family metallo-endopeptidase [Candidatus Moraniibacteriota bacterium]
MENLEDNIRGYIRDITPTGAYENGALNFENIIKNIIEKQNIGRKEEKIKSINVMKAKFESDGVSGSLTLDKKEDGNVWTINVNETDSWYRRRFIIAHEIGHLISCLNKSFSSEKISNGTGLIADFAFYNPEKINKNDINMEIEANNIAFALLMPEQTVRSLFNMYKTPEEMADYFQVSESAVAYNLNNLKDLGYSPFGFYKNI